MKRKIIALMLVATTVFQLCGCGESTSDIEDVELVSALTKQEVLDYYSEAIKVKAVVTRASDEESTSTYEEYQITGDKREELINLQSEVEAELAKQTYSCSDSNIITSDVFNYMKSYLNDLSLSGGTIDEDGVTGALGYYFVDVTYDTTAMDSGTFTGLASLVGVSGAFKEDTVSGEVSKDDTFINYIVESMNKYFILNGISKNVTYDDTNSFVINEGMANVDEYYNDSSIDDLVSSLEEDEDSVEVEENDVPTVESSLNDSEDEEVLDESVDNEEDLDGTELDLDETELDLDGTEDESVEDIDTASYSGETSDRKIKFDLDYINSVVGSASNGGAVMPELSTVYNIPASQGDLCGVAIYPSGNDGLKTFGYDRDNSESGTITLRYVFKDSEDGTGSIIGVNVYPKDYKIGSSITTADGNVLIPEYLQQEFDELIERADRVIVDLDLSGMISDNIFNDLGFGILRGYASEGTNILRCVSEVTQVISRDLESNSYLLEVQTSIVEGAKSADSYGTYTDKSYVVVQQDGTEFKITDWLRTSRKIAKEPEIDSGDAVLKRLTALNLSGEVTEEAKENVQTLLDDWYEASTSRVLNGPKDVEIDGETVTLEKGMYDCFQTDTSLLSTEQKETMNARVREMLVAHGTDVGATYSGRVSEWIGGADNQVEFTTEELIEYDDNSGTAMYVQTYYLVSCLNDEWLIDEMTIMNSEEVSGDELADLQSRIE